MKRSKLFSDEDLKRVEASVKQAEADTSGEIVTITVRQSSGYRWVRLLYGFLGIALGSLVAYLLVSRGVWIGMTETFALQAGGLVAGMGLSFWTPAFRLLLPRAQVAERVHRESLANFTAAGLHETRDRTGILIYISELEHRVEILADKGIHKKVGQDYWAEQVNQIVDGIKSGKAGDGLVNAITTMGTKLSEHFPRREDDTNELADGVMLGHQSPKKDPG
jgi:putative membrane protein